MIFTRGMRDKIANHADPSGEIIVNMSIAGNSVYDFCCFGVDSADKLSDDRYMIFYNQTVSPNGEIRYNASSNSASFALHLANLPAAINKLVFTASIDGNGVMGDITQHKFTISQNGAEKITLDLSGRDFHQEKAIISAEIYRKGEWRINAIASGFNGGLPVLLKKYGGEEDTGTPPAAPIAPIASAATAATAATAAMAVQHAPVAPVAPVSPGVQPAPIASAAPAVQPAPKGNNGGVVLRKNEEELTKEVMNKISLSKDKANLEKHVVSLSKCVVDLSKKSGIDLGSTRAKVVVALDFSGSMSRLYKDGTVQRTINRLVPLGLTFDDNGSIDVYLFHHEYMKMDDLNLSNYEAYVTNVVMNAGYKMGGTNYAPVLKAIIEGDIKRKSFFSRAEIVQPIVDNISPTFILFITDGANADRANTNDIIKRSSSMNVFIQFIGIGLEQFDYLRRLDNLPGRVRDNTGFSKMESLDKASDNVLYTNVLEQFSLWLKGMQ